MRLRMLRAAMLLLARDARQGWPSGKDNLIKMNVVDVLIKALNWIKVRGRFLFLSLFVFFLCVLVFLGLIVMLIDVLSELYHRSDRRSMSMCEESQYLLREIEKGSAPGLKHLSSRIRDYVVLYCR